MHTRENLPSFHDAVLVGYEANCETRVVKISIRRPDCANDRRVLKVTFTGVAGYHFKDDAFGNIIMSIDVVSTELFLSEYGHELVESHCSSGALGNWANSVKSANNEIEKTGLKAIVVTPVRGLSGWLLAKHIDVE